MRRHLALPALSLLLISSFANAQDMDLSKSLDASQNRVKADILQNSSMPSLSVLPKTPVKVSQLQGIASAIGGTASTKMTSGSNVSSKQKTNIDQPNHAVVPEPTSIAVITAGLIGLARRRKLAR